MKLTQLSEGILDEINTIEQIMSELSGKVLIVFSVKATTISTKEPYSQITHIAAVAIDVDSNRDIDIFNEEAGLNLVTLRQINAQDRQVSAGKWQEGDLTIRDMLNFSDYDLEEYDEGEVDKPSDMEVAIEFKSFVDEYVGRAVLVTHNAEFALDHINDTLPVPIRGGLVIDASKFMKLYFEPVLRAMMMQGSKQANDMAEKLWDEFGKFRPTLDNLGNALKIKKRKWAGSSTLEEVRQLANIFIGVLRFLKRQYKIFHDEHFRDMAARALERMQSSGTSAPEHTENPPASDF